MNWVKFFIFYGVCVHTLGIGVVVWNPSLESIVDERILPESRMTYWRNVGLSYLSYSRIAAQQLRNSVKTKKDPSSFASYLKLTFKATGAKASTPKA